MIGVVVWSSRQREKAVIWCEDQGALAYLQGRDALLNQNFWPEPGDLLELDSEVIGNLRHARRVSLLSEKSCTQLPAALRQSVEAARPDHLRLVSSQDCVPALSDSDDANPFLRRITAAR